MNNYQKCVVDFVDAAINYGEALEKGDSKHANCHSIRIIKIRGKLEADKQLLLLEPYMKDNNVYVRLCVASSLIKILPKEAKMIIEELSGIRGLVGFEAKMFIQQWDKGMIF